MAAGTGAAARRRHGSIESPRLTRDRRRAPPPGLSAPALRALYQRLREAYGPQSWWPAGSELEMVVGAILVQNTAWRSARKALDNLIAAGKLEPRALLETAEAELAELVRPSGFFNSKARKLKAFARMLADEADGDLRALLLRPPEELRPLLLATYGIGPETADAICLYAARQPTFVVDSYTKRVLGRLGLIRGNLGYETLRATFLEALPGEAAALAEYHALFVAHAKQICKKRPLCDACALLDLCPTGQAATGLRGLQSREPVPADWNR